MKLKDLLNEDTWKLEKGEILFNGKKVGTFEYEYEADAFWIDDMDKNGTKGFGSKEKAIQWLKKNKKAYLDRHNNDYHRKERDYLSRFDYYDESVNEVKIHHMAREGALDNLKEVILNIGPFSKEVVKHCEAAIKIIEKFDSNYKR
jgi:hypothetical protein